MKKLTAIAVVTMTLGLSSCLSILPDPAPADAVYRLKPSYQTVQAEPTAWVIRIDRPSADNIFQNRDIIVSPDGQRLATAALAKWAETTPVLVQGSFVDVLSERPGLVGVLPVSGARTDTRLHITVKNFEAHFDQGEDSAPLAVVDYDIVLANASDRNLIDTVRVRKTKRASAARVSSIVDAIDGANRDALNEVADWLEDHSTKKTG